MNRFFGWYSRGLEAIMAIGMVSMVTLVFGNVVLRYVFNSGISMSEELSRWLFIWITFLGAILALRERAHLGSGFLLDRLPTAGKKVCLVIGHLLMLAGLRPGASGFMGPDEDQLRRDCAFERRVDGDLLRQRRGVRCVGVADHRGRPHRFAPRQDLCR